MDTNFPENVSLKFTHKYQPSRNHSKLKTNDTKPASFEGIKIHSNALTTITNIFSHV